MAEEIVSCTGCGKKFRIPEGSPPTGAFACTACGADVAYGAAPASGGNASGGKSRSRRGGSTKAASAASKRAAAEEAKKPSRGARRARGRREPEPEPEAEEARGRRRAVAEPKENRTLPIVIAIMGAVALLFIGVLIMTGEEPDYEKQAAEALAARQSNEKVAAATGLSSSGTPTRPAPEATPAGSAAAHTTPVAPLPTPTETDEPDEDSGIGGVKGGDPSSRAHNYSFFFSKFRANRDECFTEMDPVPGTTDAEVSSIRTLADTACDFDAGASGMKAEGDIVKVGKKAMPFLLNQFVKHWNGSKWNEKDEQWAAWKVQKLMKQITMKDGPPSEFVAVFQPRGGDVGPDKFERAATMWIAWWHGEGQYFEAFTPYPDTGE